MLCRQLWLLSAVLALIPSVAGYYYYACGRYNRYCGIYARCSYGKCVCDYGYYGCPLVECHYPDEYQCAVKADPHLVAFANAKGDLNWPCKYRLTRLQHPLEGGTAGVAFCGFEVFGYNEVINGKFFASGVEISFGIGDFANQFFVTEDVIKFDINENGVGSSDGNVTEWGTGVHGSFNGITVECDFNDYYRFAVLDIPRCGFRVLFRPYDHSAPPGPQPFVPAISIVVSGQTIFNRTVIGMHPQSLCGMTVNQGDDTYLYIDRAVELGLDNPTQALLYDALNQNLEQQSLVPDFTDAVLQNSAQCQVSVDTFSNCSEANKVTAVRVCSVVLKRLAACCGPDVITAFNACVGAVCVDKTAGCIAYSALLGSHGCGNGPRKVRRFCASGAAPTTPASATTTPLR